MQLYKIYSREMFWRQLGMDSVNHYGEGAREQVN